MLLTKSGHHLTLTLGYGDSGDGTGVALFDECANLFDAHLIEVNHGGPDFGSVVHPTRFKQMAMVANRLWQAIPTRTDYVLILESDLIWRPSILGCLLNNIVGIRSIQSNGSAHTLLAPLIIDSDGLFYDTWAFRKNGVNFQKYEPYYPDISYERYLWDMDSVGSCIILNYELARQLTIPEEDVLVGFCRKARELGARIVVDTHLAVMHL